MIEQKDNLVIITGAVYCLTTYQAKKEENETKIE